MTMHLAPGLTTTGKSKKKARFRNADAARTARENQSGWAAIKEAHGVIEEKKKNRGLTARPYVPAPLAYRGKNDPVIPSLDTGASIAPAPPAKVYTGNKMLGIATLHKSNAVPVFSTEEAIDIAKMRRG